MLKALKNVLIVMPIVLLFSIDGNASVRPESLKLQAYSHTDQGNKLAMYAVKCSDGSYPVIVKTVGEREWTLAGNRDGEIYRDKIKAAQNACQKASDSQQRLADASK